MFSINIPENEVSVKTTLVPWQMISGLELVKPASGFLFTYIVAAVGKVSPQAFTALILICLDGASGGVPTHGAKA